MILVIAELKYCNPGSCLSHRIFSTVHINKKNLSVLIYNIKSSKGFTCLKLKSAAEYFLAFEEVLSILICTRCPKKVTEF